MFRPIKFIKTEKPHSDEVENSETPSNVLVQWPIIIKNDDDDPTTCTEAVPVHPPAENTDNVEEVTENQEQRKLSSLMNDRQTHNAKKPFKCDVCGLSFHIKKLLTKHKVRHSSDSPFQCELCQKTFKRKIKLSVHKLTHSSKRPFKCEVCHMTFKWKKNLTMHQLTHSFERPFKCEVCHKAFKGKSDLARHKLTHSSERPFKCSECDKSFKRLRTLNAHKVLHSSERPFKCEQCGKTFKTLYSLKKHSKIVHTDERPFKCTECGSAFKCGSHLKRHKLLHCRAKSFKCSKCHLCFPSETSRRAHETSNHLYDKYFETSRRHKNCSSTDVKPVIYECFICKTAFANEYDLCQHKGTRCSLQNFNLRASNVVLERLSPKQLAEYGVFSYPRLRIRIEDFVIKKEPE